MAAICSRLNPLFYSRLLESGIYAGCHPKILFRKKKCSASQENGEGSKDKLEIKCATTVHINVPLITVF